MLPSDLVPVTESLSLGAWLDSMPHLADLFTEAEHMANVIDEAGEWMEEE